MRIIPVLDLKDETVVHAVAGRRREYKPIVSTLCSSTRPLDVATAFRERLGASAIYLADLDGICGDEPDWDSIESLSAEGFNLLLDAGQKSIKDSGRVCELDVRLIVASEWMRSPRELDRAIESLGIERVVFSLDLHGNTPAVRSPEWQSLSSLEILERVASAGVTGVVLLDIANVGSVSGPSQIITSLCREVIARFPGIELITGGGVRSQRDIETLRSVGSSSVLVATALHDGSLPV